MLKTDIALLKKIVRPIAEKYKLGQIKLFGSRARNDATEKSDYDFFIQSGQMKGFFQLGCLFNDLEDALHASVDIVVEPGKYDKLDDYLIKAIEEDGILLYER